MIIQKHDLDVTPSGVLPVVNASQYDVGRIIKFYLYNESEVYNIPVGTSVLVNGIKPNGDAFSYSATYTDNVVTVTLTDQMTVIDGEVKCELRFADSLGNDIGTTNFILLVEKAPFDASIPISETEIPAIIELARAEQYNAEAWAVGEKNGIPVSPTDPTYHNNAKYWSENAQHGSLDNLSDVVISSPTDGQIIYYDAQNNEWTNGDVSVVASLDDLTDTDITTPTNGQVLSYDDVNSKWVNDDLPNIPDELSDLSDVNLASPSNGQVMTYNGTSQKWENKDIPSDTVTQAIIASVEVSPSLHAYAVGEQLIYNDTLYTVTAAISIGDALVVGTNITASDTVIEQVDDNKSDIQTLHDGWQKNGAYNLCPIEATTQVVNGVTYTVNADGTISTSGATTTNTSQLTICNVTLPKGTYKAVGCPTGGSSSPWTYYVIYKKDNASGETLGYDEGNGCTLTLATDTVVNIRIIINTNTDMSGKVFKPMITTDLNATYADYVPHAMTNRQLTPQVSTATITQAGVTVGTNKLSKQGNVVNLHLTLTGLTCDAYANIGSIPTEYRPKNDVMIQAIQYNASDAPIIIGVLSASGYIQVRKSLTSANIATISATWTTN